MKRLLQVCFIAAMVFGLASCEKEKDNTSSGGSSAATPTSLAGTDWSYFDGEATVVVSFVSASSVEVHVSTPNGPESYYGSYTYSNGNGTMNLTVRNQVYEITFTVNGNTMTAYDTPSGDVTLTRGGGSGGGGQQPPIDLRTSVVGTGWMYMNDDVVVVVEFGPDNMVGIVVSPKNGGNDMEYYGTYTYNNFNGTISITVENQDYTIHFVINGETMVASDTPVGNITLTRMNK